MTPLLSTPGKGEIILYKAKDGTAQIDVRMEEETVWLSLDQMASLFGRDNSVISRHIKNVFKTAELSQDSVVAKFATTAADGKTYQVDYYNLDMILSIGYRVNSKRGTQFRIWATNVLRQHLLQGYSLHQKRLQEKGLKELEGALELVRRASSNRELSGDEARGLLKVITDYAETWLLLRAYDEGDISLPAHLQKSSYVLTYADALTAIAGLREKLRQENAASELFGLERGEALQSIIGNIRQTFDDVELYPTLEEKAAHLLYFVIKDHPFSDGNKRIAVLLFLHFLDRNHALARAMFSSNMLVALALLIAESDPRQKEVMLRMILHFVSPIRESAGRA